jgi:hypothetical protein
MSSVTWRPATQDELERCEVTDQANLIDGAGAVLVNGGLVGLTNEYGTCVWSAEGVSPHAVENVNQAAGDLV